MMYIKLWHMAQRDYKTPETFMLNLRKRKNPFLYIKLQNILCSFKRRRLDVFNQSFLFSPWEEKVYLTGLCQFYKLKEELEQVLFFSITNYVQFCESNLTIRCILHQLYFQKFKLDYVYLLLSLSYLTLDIFMATLALHTL